MDRKKEQIERFRYDFELGDLSTVGLARTGRSGVAARRNVPTTKSRATISREEYMAKVEAVREGMRQGEYYEVVLRQTFQANYSESASALFQRIQKAQPQPLRVFAATGRRATDRRVARDVRARGGQSRGDLPDRGNRAPHGRSAARRRQHSRVAELHQRRIRADHVQRRGSQRQIARVDSRVGEGDRAAADRIVRGRVPHRGSRGRHAAAGLRFAGRVSHAHVGGDHYGRAQESRGAGHRGSGKRRARLVRRRGGHAVAERRHQYRHFDPHRSSARRNRALQRRRDAALRFGSGARRTRDAPEGHWIFPRVARREESGRRPRPQRDSAGTA